jgi:hypothetical protein
MSSTFLHTLFLACLAFLPASASADFRGQYELVLSGAHGTTSIRSASTHSDGEPMVHELGEYTVTLQPTFLDDGTYELQVSAAPLVKNQDGVPISNSQRFSGVVRQPLEFEAALGAVSVTGAIVLQRLRE